MGKDIRRDKKGKEKGGDVEETKKQGKAKGRVRRKKRMVTASIG